MAEIVRITIGSSSGYCPVEYVYEDRLTICADSIRYECRPWMEDGEIKAVKWSYKTNGSLFRELFGEVRTAVEPILEREEERHLVDVGETTVTVTYEDKKRRKRTFCMPGEELREFFSLVKRMVPGCEETPVAITTEE